MPKVDSKCTFQIPTLNQNYCTEVFYCTSRKTTNFLLSGETILYTKAIFSYHNIVFFPYKPLNSIFLLVGFPLPLHNERSVVD
jgi:hypothetical protein